MSKIILLKLLVSSSKFQVPCLKIYIPFTSMVLVSIVISVILWIFRK